ncbi:uncharacterized protein LOC128391824 [Panonychus citri]|uniref:uncharacterized protein LOC128391824 n=1 Tax=Panonychus citri TaxID=50023 RepID=UPI00230743E2|nr:uncharacterized protein LOC128391824 [Panonychus citri]
MDKSELDKFIRRVNTKIPTRKEWMVEIATIPIKDLMDIVNKTTLISKDLKEGKITLQKVFISKISHVVSYMKDNPTLINLTEEEREKLNNLESDLIIVTPPTPMSEGKKIRTYSGTSSERSASSRSTRKTAKAKSIATGVNQGNDTLSTNSIDFMNSEAFQLPSNPQIQDQIEPGEPSGHSTPIETETVGQKTIIEVIKESTQPETSDQLKEVEVVPSTSKGITNEKKNIELHLSKDDCISESSEEEQDIPSIEGLEGLDEVMDSPPRNPLKRKFGSIDLHKETIKVRLDKTRKIKKVFHRVEEKPIPSSWKPWSSSLMDPIVLVTHISIPPSKLMQEISQALKSKALEAFPAKIIKGRDAIRVVCSDLQDIQLAKSSLLAWNCDLTIKNPSCFDPKIKLTKIPMNIETDEQATALVDRLMIQNGAGGKGNWSFSMRFASKQLNRTDIIINVSPRIRDFVQERRGKFFFNFKEITVVDYFHVSLCYRCFSYDHSAKLCKNQICCRYCSGSHDGKTCGVKFNKNAYRCDVCKRKGKEENHTPFDWECPEYQRRLRHAIQLINYDYQWIMRE